MLLEVHNLSVSYGGCQALRDVSLTVAEKEIVGLCGPNKAGKSTLCKCLAGTVSCDSGEILLNGEAITRVPAFRRPSLGISFCPEGRGIYPGISVGNNLHLSCDGISSRERNARIDQVLGYFPYLAKRLGQQAGTLSGGESQMLGIARSLLRRPRLLIIDEPSLGLAPKAINAVFAALSQIQQDFGMSVLLVEEAITRLVTAVDRAYVLHLGTKVAEGSVEELIDSPAVAAAFIGELDARTIKNGEVSGYPV